jgi:hypothetical protein
LRKVIAALAAMAGLAVVSSASAGTWTTSVPFTNQPASSPTPGWGYQDVNDAPVPGTCGPGQFNSNRSESWIAVVLRGAAQ